jgi:hypothetical protein
MEPLVRRLVALLIVLAGCHLVILEPTPSRPWCTGLDEHRCGTECCDEYRGWFCNIYAKPSLRCEYSPTPPQP